MTSGCEYAVIDAFHVKIFGVDFRIAIVRFLWFRFAFIIGAMSVWQLLERRCANDVHDRAMQAESCADNANDQDDRRFDRHNCEQFF